METTTFNPTISATYAAEEKKISVFAKFFTWCAAQQKNRLLWLALIMAIHGCALTPITMMAVLLGGADLALILASIVAMGLALVTNLAAMPTNVTIPTFAISVLADIIIMIIALSNGVDISGTYI